MPFFFDLTHFRSLGQKSKNNFVWFLVQMRTRKFAFEIYWPLVISHQFLCSLVNSKHSMISHFADKYDRKCSDSMAKRHYLTFFPMTVFEENGKNPELIPKQLHK